MVILYSQQGQLANRLWQAAYFISNAIENDYTLIHLGFADYLIYFDENCNPELRKLGGKCRIIDFKTTSLRDRIIIKYANTSRKLLRTRNVHLPKVVEIKIDIRKYEISTEDFKRKAKEDIVLADGFLFTDISSLEKHSDAIRRIFKPNNIFLKNVENLVNKYFRKYDVVVGVHIRRGDYATYKEGRFFFSDQDYISFIKQTALLFKNKNVAFFLCSDAEITIKDIEGVNLIFPTNHLIEDLYTLAECNFIIGPPSTYSWWASFYGKVPLFHIENKNVIIKEENFKLSYM